MIKNTILTEKAIEVINKKLKGKSLTQQDSNYLSRFVRPKLKDILSINAENLLKKLEYNPKALSIERKIKKIMLKEIQDIEAIIVCGSAIQTNYKKYNDIDIIIAIKTSQKDNSLKDKIIEEGKKENLNLDVQIYARSSILAQYPSNPSLIYQLKDSKVIYGKLNIPNKIRLSSLDLKMKLDWSEDLDMNSNADEIYLAIRNALLVSLLINKQVDNYQLKQNLISFLGQDLLNKLKNNQASKIEKKLSLNYLNTLTNYLEKELSKPKWEKIVIENLS